MTASVHHPIYGDRQRQIYYRCILSEDHELFFFEVGNVWYCMSDQLEVGRAANQDMKQREAAGHVMRAIPSNAQVRAINEFVVKLVLNL